MMENIIKTVFAALVTLSTYLFGGADMWLMALVTAVIIDYMSGIARAYILGELSSQIGFKGIVRKVMYFMVVAVAVIVDNITGANNMVRAAAIGFLIANEAISILENYALATGKEVPPILVKILKELKEDKKE